MRKAVAFAAAIAALPTYASAQPGVGGLYGELGIGLSIIQDVETEPFSIDSGIGILAGTMEADFSSPQATFGGEVGYAGPQWRFGASYDYMDASLERAAFSGSFDGSPLDITLEEADLDAVGIQRDLGFLIAAGNVYYNFRPSRSPVEPYIGFGAGAAFIQNASTELALSATAGARFAITPRAYVGARYRFTHIAGPEDDGGIQYENVLIHVVTVQFGLYFGPF